ncbi:ribosomal protein S6--L-glutamate ligase [Marinomonas alcarazii]|uniref:Ribosomal protein S6--L-glutamate ligase n=1 Tax=Marinomonas alcarazii TaxID=491949 RepID=A0A318V304_9GAMM|nr:GAK system ATP-grasp enzyme [Marinomonas alcarazii]PYF80545.1 ribosomal protein S6--L-glutamate ligase [Marinomonas alcarazii]
MNKPRIGVIGIPGKWSTEVLADRLEERTGFRAVIDMSQVELRLDTNQLMYKNLDLMTLDGLVIKKISDVYSPATEDRIHLLSYAERAGVKLFSPTQSVGNLVNRLSGTLALQQGNIPMPLTRITENPEQAFATVREFGSAILKPLYSTKARGMIMLTEDDSDEFVRNALEEYRQSQSIYYIQQTVKLDGRDLGMVFVGGEYLCTYARVGNKDSWNTTINSGGKYEQFEPDAELIELGRRAQSCYDLSFTTVDIALTDKGPVVFEVSAFGGFKGALEGCDIDAASVYADFVLEQCALQECVQQTGTLQKKEIAS